MQSCVFGIFNHTIVCCPSLKGKIHIDILFRRLKYLTTIFIVKGIKQYSYSKKSNKILQDFSPSSDPSDRDPNDYDSRTEND